MACLRSVMVFDTAIDADAFARSCSEWGVDTPCLHPGFLEDGTMARALDRRGLRPWLNIPVFCDPRYLERAPGAYAITSLGRRAAQDWLHFVCPSREDYLDAAVEALGRNVLALPLAMVSLDFIRHFVFWERVPIDGPSSGIEDGCYCPLCLSRFEKECGASIDRRDAAAHIRRDLMHAWADWKCRRIVEVADRFIDEIRRLAPGVPIAVQTLPWRESDLDGAIRSHAGQDVAGLARHADVVAPMAFTHLLGKTPQWKEQFLVDMRACTGKPVAFYVQVEAPDRAGAISTEQFDAELTHALQGDRAAIVVLEYEQLAARPEKAQVLRKHFRP